MEESVKINNVEDLRNDLLKVYSELRAGKIGIREAKGSVSAASVIISSAKAQMEYNAFTKADSKIDFFEK